MQIPASGVVTLAPGATQATVTFNGSNQTPIGGAGHLMRSVNGTSNILAVLDWKTLSPNSGTFYLNAPVPNDGTVYKLFFIFHYAN